MTDAKKIKIGMTGDFRHPEFSGILETLGRSARFIEWSQILQGDIHSVDFLLIGQTRRGQFSQDSIYQVVSKFPLAQKMVVTGSWCEGETRSGHPLEGIHRIPLKDVSFELDRLFVEFSETGTTWLSRPVTETRADYLAATTNAPEACGPLNIAIHSLTPDSFQTISGFCRKRGWDVARPDTTTRFDLVIVECCYSVTEAISVVQLLNTNNSSVPALIICGFPRRQDHEKLASCLAIFELVGKPFDNGLLDQAVKRLIQNGKLKVVSDVA